MRVKKTVIVGLIVAVILALIFRPQYIKSVQDGLLLFCVNVLPALFPFFFFTKLLTELGVAEDLGIIFKKPLKFLYNAPPVSGYIYIMSLLSGYPVGARLVYDFYQQGLLDTEDCKSVCSFCSTSGALFIVGTVGSCLLNNATFGILLYVIHIASSALNGLLYRSKKKLNTQNYNAKTLDVKNTSILSVSIESAIGSILMVGGYIAIFNFIVDLCIDFKFIDALAKPFEYLSMLINFKDYQAIKPSIMSLIEMTRGAMELSKLQISAPVLLGLISMAVAFGGMSVTLQSMTYLSQCKISPLYYLKTKITQGVIAGFLGYIFALILF
ncbi:MAG: hypothetical protein RR357_00765 [Clostridia bacterium]